MIVIDGSIGEGGGQVLRSALALSMVTGRALRIENIRAGRSRPGLLRQHLTAVQAAAEVSGARVEGAEVGSRALDFAPGAVRPGSYRFAVGTAGSATLVLQTVLPPLLLAAGPSELVLEGGTHNPLAPPFDFLARSFLPLIAKMGPKVEAVLERPGFYPAGGGRMRVRIEPADRLARLDLADRGEVLRRRARALVSSLPPAIGHREVKVVMDALGWGRSELQVEEVRDPVGPGNVLLLEVECEHAIEVVTGFGERGVRAEEVARRAVEEARRFLDARVPVGEHLADQLLLPMALAGGGSFRTLTLTRHATTGIEVMRRFLDVEVKVTEDGPDACRVEIVARS